MEVILWRFAGQFGTESHKMGTVFSKKARLGNRSKGRHTKCYQVIGSVSAGFQLVGNLENEKKITRHSQGYRCWPIV
jgi:hypothetical protein